MSYAPLFFFAFLGACASKATDAHPERQLLETAAEQNGGAPGGGRYHLDAAALPDPLDEAKVVEAAPAPTPVVAIDNALSECADVQVTVEKTTPKFMDVLFVVTFRKITGECGCKSSLTKLQVDRKDSRGRTKNVIDHVFDYFKYAKTPYEARDRIASAGFTLPVDVHLGCAPN